MQNNFNKANCCFYLFLCAHLIGWTLIPALIRYNLPLDAIEGIIWGQQLDWGYDKNPFLNGWLTALAVFLDGHSGWMTYLFSQISVILCFWAVWQLAKKMLSPVNALISVLILEGIQYYNFHAIDFNDNTLELSLWALTIYCFYEALTSAKHRVIPWILTGLFAGLGMMAKYYTAVLLIPMALFLLINPKNQKQFRTLPPYLGLVTFFIVMLPHIIWLYFHDFITVFYVFKRMDTPPGWFNHLFYPTQFILQQAEVLIPTLLLFSLLMIGRKPWLSSPRTKLDSFHIEFLYFMGLGPFLLTILISLLSGVKLRAGWGMPLLSLWGILLFTLVQPRITRAKIYGFLFSLFTFMCLSLSAYSVSLIKPTTPSSANFPGIEIAQTITNTWNDLYHTKLTYVAGSRWVSGNISFYSVDHPSVFLEWNEHRSPWIDIDDLQEKGAVFVWNISAREFLPIDVQKRFPQLLHTFSLEFPWKRNQSGIKPTLIGIAFLPPKNIA